ncbi:MAG: hypothetical protein ABJ370_02490 [Paracoccaceae bacterium]
MKIIAHIGAHRTSSTSFQAYLDEHRTELAQDSVAVWGLERTRKGLFAGLKPKPGPAYRKDAANRARGRIGMQLDKAEMNGVRTLLVSEENMIGSTRANLSARQLYPAIGEQMARYAWAFDQRIERIILSVRSHEFWWSSAISYAVSRGASVPSSSELKDIVTNRRGWRDVITDLHCAVPEAEILVMPFEAFAGRPALMLKCGAGCNAPEPRTVQWLNRSPELAELRRALQARGENVDVLPHGQGRWSPFSDEQQAELRELYADDLFWLTAGADGLAKLMKDPLKETWRNSQAGRAYENDRGHSNDGQQRQVARPG